MDDVKDIVLEEFDPESPDVLAVQTDYVAAFVPHSDFARDLSTQADTVTAAGNGGNLKILAEKREAISYVNPYTLKIKEGWNVRNLDTPSNRARIYSLARSIAIRGVTVPISVHLENGSFFVTDGHCRLMAAFHAINVLGAQIRLVPITEESKHSSLADRLATQGIRNSGKALEPLEMAELCHRLLGYGWTEQQMADSFTYTRGRIMQLLELRAGATPQIKEMISKGQITPSFAGRVIRQTDAPEGAEKILAGAVANAHSKGKDKARPKDIVHNMAPRPSREKIVEGAEHSQEGKAGAANYSKQTPPKYTKIDIEASSIPLQDLADPKLREILLESEIFKTGDGVMIKISATEFERLLNLSGLSERQLSKTAA